MGKRRKKHRLPPAAKSGDVVVYIPAEPELSTSLAGGAACTAIIFLLGGDQAFSAKLVLSLMVVGLFLVRHFVGLLCPDPYAPLSELEQAELEDGGFQGDEG